MGNVQIVSTLENERSKKKSVFYPENKAGYVEHAF